MAHFSCLNYFSNSSIIDHSFNNASFLARIEAKAQDIADQLHHEFPHSVITYHATGGNKLMMLGFCAIFAKENNQVIYTHTAQGHIEFIYPRDKSIIAIEPVLNLKNYLRSLGFAYRNSSSDSQSWTDKALNKKRQQLSHWLAENALFLDKFLGEMNKHAEKALTRDNSKINEANKTITLENDFVKQYADTLKKLNEAGICQWLAVTPRKITFTNANGAKYMMGFWLEEYVWLIVHDLDISEVKSNVEFSRGEDAIKNEMDCIAVHNNRLLAIECKAAALDKRDTRDSNNMLYKLEALGKGIGGLYHEKWLVSARPVPLEVEQRAKTAGIKIIDPDSLKNLKTELEKWRDSKR
jgi:hypothetical protein